MLKYIPILNKIDFETLYIRMNEVVKEVFNRQDFEGQKQAEKNYKIILVIFMIISMVISYATQTLSHGVFIMLAGLAVSMIVMIDIY